METAFAECLGTSEFLAFDNTHSDQRRS